jgi:predicted dehydrogenase
MRLDATYNLRAREGYQMADRLGVAIVGTGTIANSHMRSLSQHAPANVVAVFDVLGDRARAFAERWSIPNVARELGEVLERKDVEAVIVATPPFAHMAATVAALEAGKHVLCEKPFALRLGEAERMVATAEQVGRFLAVCSGRQRCGAAMRKADALREAGELGEVYHARCTQLRFRGRPGIDILRESAWFVDSERAGGGSLMDTGVYRIDMLLALLGHARVKSVLAQTKLGIGAVPPGSPEQDVEDHATVMVACENGASAVLESAWSSNMAGADALVVFGTKAGLRFDPLTLIYPGRVRDQRAMEERVLGVEDRDTRGFGDISQQFVDGVLAGRQPLTPAREALEVTRVISAAYESARTGRAVELN